MLKLYNTLSRSREAFKPLVAGEVGLYVCGMTVYDHCHIGHGRMMVVYDLLYRHLQASGLQVKYVRNITDVDDKIIRRSVQDGVTPDAVANRFIDAMREDERALSVLPPAHEPRATETIAGMIALIEKLIVSGHAYVGKTAPGDSAVESVPPAAGNDVYFAVRQFAGYGKLSGRKLEDLRAGERVAVDTAKQDPLDFVLWKAAKPDEPHWPSPWGPGRPGWHIECSAMSTALLGEEFDIHGGGLDLKFPHHENEIAQSEAAHDGRFARYWMHSGLVRTDGEKMSKSLGNFFTIRDVLEHYSGEEIRAFYVASHYRSPLNYSIDALDAARAALRRLYTALRGRVADDAQAAAAAGGDAKPDLDEPRVARFVAAMDDDLNTPEALAVLHELASALNRETDPQSAASHRLSRTLRVLGGRLGLLQAAPDTVLQQAAGSAGQGDTGLDNGAIEALIAERVSAREQKDFTRSDAIRDQLAAAGVVLEDVGGKTTWRRH